MTGWWQTVLSVGEEDDLEVSSKAIQHVYSTISTGGAGRGVRKGDGQACSSAVLRASETWASERFDFQATLASGLCEVLFQDSSVDAQILLSLGKRLQKIKQASDIRQKSPASEVENALSAAGPWIACISCASYSKKQKFETHVVEQVLADVTSILPLLKTPEATKHACDAISHSLVGRGWAGEILRSCLASLLKIIPHSLESADRLEHALAPLLRATAAVVSSQVLHAKGPADTINALGGESVLQIVLDGCVSVLGYRAAHRRGGVMANQSGVSAERSWRKEVDEQEDSWFRGQLTVGSQESSSVSEWSVARSRGRGSRKYSKSKEHGAAGLLNPDSSPKPNEPRQWAPSWSASESEGTGSIKGGMTNSIMTGSGKVIIQSMTLLTTVVKICPRAIISFLGRLFAQDALLLVSVLEHSNPKVRAAAAQCVATVIDRSRTLITSTASSHNLGGPSSASQLSFISMSGVLASVCSDSCNQLVKAGNIERVEGTRLQILEALATLMEIGHSSAGLVDSCIDETCILAIKCLREQDACDDVQSMGLRLLGEISGITNVSKETRSLLLETVPAAENRISVLLCNDESPPSILAVKAVTAFAKARVDIIWNSKALDKGCIAKQLLLLDPQKQCQVLHLLECIALQTFGASFWDDETASVVASVSSNRIQTWKEMIMTPLLAFALETPNTTVMTRVLAVVALCPGAALQNEGFFLQCCKVAERGLASRSANVVGAAFKAVGCLFCSEQSILAQPSVVSHVFSWLTRASSGASQSVQQSINQKSWRMWCAANFAASLVICEKESDLFQNFPPELIQNFSDDGQVQHSVKEVVAQQLLKLSLQGLEDNDKVRAQACRCLGSSGVLLSPSSGSSLHSWNDCLDGGEVADSDAHRAGEGASTVSVLPSHAVHWLRVMCGSQTFNTKARWNACTAMEKLLSSGCFRSLASSMVNSLIVAATGSHVKVATHGCQALLAIPESALFTVSPEGLERLMLAAAASEQPSRQRQPGSVTHPPYSLVKQACKHLFDLLTPSVQDQLLTAANSHELASSLGLVEEQEMEI